jgi:hypothetical protein
MRKSTLLVVLAVVMWSRDIGSVHFVKGVVQLAGSRGRVGGVEG